MIIQHNISALNSYNRLSGNNKALAKNLEKLSSGYKINRAADDAAGLAISEKMRAQITGMNRAQQNSKDGISLVQTAEGALTEVHSMLNRMVDLTTQASNGIYTDTERTKIQDELKQLESEIDRIADATNFNGIKLLDGSMGSGGGGSTTKAVIDSDLTKTYTPAEIGENKVTITTGALDKAGAKQDFTFSFENGDPITLEVELGASGKFIVNGEEIDQTYTNTGATAGEVAAALGAVLTDKLEGKMEVTVNNADISFKALEAGKTGVMNFAGAVGNKGTKADGTVNTAVPTLTFATTNAQSDAKDTVAGTDLTAYNGTNLDDAIFTINGKKFILADTATKDTSGLDSDINVIHGTTASAGVAQQISQVLGPDVTVSFANNALEFTGAAAGGAGLQLQIGDTADSFNQLMVSVSDCHAKAIGVSGLSVADPAVAAQSMEKAKAAIEEISKTRSLLGATQNRLDHTLANLEETTTNLTEAESRIRDTDMANEMMKYTKNNILIQSSQAMLAQANQVPQGVLQLLQ